MSQTVPNVISSWNVTSSILFNNSNGLRTQILWVPGSNGAKIDIMGCLNLNTTASLLYLLELELLTTQGSSPTGTVAFTHGAPDTITRVNNSFITDGWLAGDLLVAGMSTPLSTTPPATQVATTSTGNQIVFQIASLTATALTLTSTNTAVAENLIAGSALYRVYPSGFLSLTAAADANTPKVFDILANTSVPGIKGGSDKYYRLEGGTLLVGPQQPRILACCIVPTGKPLVPTAVPTVALASGMWTSVKVCGGNF